MSDRRRIYFTSDNDVSDQQWIQAARKEWGRKGKGHQRVDQEAELHNLGIYSEEYFEALELFDERFRRGVGNALVDLSDGYVYHYRSNGYSNYISYRGVRLTDDESVEYLAREIECQGTKVLDAKGLLGQARKIRKKAS